MNGTTGSRVMARRTIGRLNREAAAAAATGSSLRGALEATAARHRLEVAATQYDQDTGVLSLVLYQSPSGRLVNCWYSGTELDDRIADGGLGFDDQIELHYD